MVAAGEEGVAGAGVVVVGQRQRRGQIRPRGLFGDEVVAWVQIVVLSLTASVVL